MVADAIILEASLSFLGAGVQDPAPSLGQRHLLRPQPGPVRRLVGHHLRRPAHPAHRAGPEHPGRGPHRRHGEPEAAQGACSEGRRRFRRRCRRRHRRRHRDRDVRGAAVQWWNSTSSTASAPPPAMRLRRGARLRRWRRHPARPAPAIANPHALLDQELELLAAVEAGRADRLPQVPADARTVLEVKNLSIRFPGRFGDTAIVDNVSFTVREGETMGLVGESGCGKSITSLAIMGLLPKTARISGSITFDGKELLDPATGNSSAKAYQGLRGEQIAMVYQDALSSLNPSMKIKDQMLQLTKRGGRKTPTELLELVKLDPVRTLRQLPARALRRPAPARPDRHGAVPLAQDRGGRRAHHRAGRHRAETGGGPAQRTARAARLRDGLRQPRPRPGGVAGPPHHRDVRGPGGGIRAGVRAAAEPQARIHPRPARRRALHRGRRRPPAPDPRHRARPRSDFAAGRPLRRRVPCGPTPTPTSSWSSPSVDAAMPTTTGPAT